MKFLTIILIAFAFLPVQAKVFYPIKTVKKFFKKDKICEFAVGNLLTKGDSRVMANVYCVSTMVFNEETINETQGCSLFFYNVNTNINTMGVKKLHSFAGSHRGIIPIVKDVDCKKGGFEKLLRKKGYQITNDSYKGEKLIPGKWATVEDVLRYGTRGDSLEKKQAGHQVLLKSTNPKFRAWWNSKKK